jgi:hypothetical protein
MVASRDQDAGRSYNINIDNSSSEKLEEIKYLGTTYTNQYPLYLEIKSRLNSGNACYHSVQNTLPSDFLSKKVQIKILTTIILHLLLYGRENWSLKLKKGRRLMVF